MLDSGIQLDFEAHQLLFVAYKKHPKMRIGYYKAEMDLEQYHVYSSFNKSFKLLKLLYLPDNEHPPKTDWESLQRWWNLV